MAASALPMAKHATDAPPERLSDEQRQRFERETKSAPVVIYMKGTPDMPMCGFSAGAAGAFEDLGVEVKGVNVLEDPEAWQGIKTYTGWPTIPQVFVGGEFIGGCDIVREMRATGELQELVEKAGGSAR